MGIGSRPGARLLPGLLAGLILTSPISSQDEVSRQELARDVRRKVAELQGLQEQVDAEREQQAAEIGTLQAHIEKLELDVARARTEVAELERELDRRQSELVGHLENAETAEKRVGRVAERARELVESLHRRATKGIPSVQQVAPKLAAWGDRLDAGELERRATATASLNEFLGAHLERHRQRTIGNRLVELPASDVARHAYIARLGGVAEVFLTEGGQMAGIAAREAGAAWRTPVQDDRRSDVQEIISVLRKQSPPRWVDVPVLLPPAGEPGS